VIDSERQLSGKVVDEEVRSAFEKSDYMTPEQFILIDAILTLPETSPEKEIQRRIVAINAVTAYCGVEEGRSLRRNRPGQPTGNDVSMAVKTEEPAQYGSDTVLDQAIRSVMTDKRPRICFLCLGKPNLPIRKRVFEFSTPGCLSKHFMKVHAKNVKNGESIDCRICDVRLVHRMHLQHYAEKFHGTVLRACI